MKRETLLESRDYWIVQIQQNLYTMIERYMKEKKMSRTDLAKELKVTKGYITQILNGDFDHKVSKLVDLALATGNAPLLNFVNMKQYISDDAANNLHFYKPGVKPVSYNTYIDGNNITSLMPTSYEDYTFNPPDSVIYFQIEQPIPSAQ